MLAGAFASNSPDKCRRSLLSKALFSAFPKSGRAFDRIGAICAIATRTNPTHEPPDRGKRPVDAAVGKTKERSILSAYSMPLEGECIRQHGQKIGFAMSAFEDRADGGQGRA